MDNAHRLLMDAKILESRGRYAVGSFACDIVVGGKRQGVPGPLETPRPHDPRYLQRPALGHILKQRILGTYFFTKAAFETVFSEDGKEVNPNDDDDEVIERAAKAGYERAGATLFIAKYGAMDFMKMAGFYVDLNEQLEVISKGGDIDAADAARHIKDAETAFEIAMAPPILHRGMVAVYETSKHKPKRRTRELYEAVWKMVAEPEPDKA